jgi:septal ring factor EnvC (AmiA/AmiB activator)
MSNDILIRLDRLTDIQQELENILQTLVLNDSTIIDALAQMLGAIQQMNARAIEAQVQVTETQAKLTAEINRLAEAISALQGRTTSPPTAPSPYL